MSLSAQPSKLVPLIDQSLYEHGYLISNSEGAGREGKIGGMSNSKDREQGGCGGGGSGGQKKREGLEEKREEES